MQSNVIENHLSVLKDSTLKWSRFDLTDLIDSFKKTAQDLIEQNKKAESSRRIIKQMISSIQSDFVEKSDVGRIVRLYQREIEANVKRYEEERSILIGFKASLSVLPSVTETLASSVSLLQQKASIIDQIGEAEGQLKMRESSSNASSVSAQIDMDISNFNEKRSEIEKVAESVNNDIDQFALELKQVSAADKQSQQEFSDECSEIESKTVADRKTLEDLRAKNSSETEASLRLELSSIQDEISRGKLTIENENGIESIKNEVIEKEHQVADRLKAIEKNLEGLPTEEEWKDVQIELSKSDSFEFSRIESEQNNYLRQISEVEANIAKIRAESDLIQLNNERMDEDLRKFAKKLEAIQSGSEEGEELFASLLKEEKQRLQGSIEDRMVSIQGMQREKQALDGKIQALRGEKESLLAAGDYGIERKKESRRLVGFEKYLIKSVNMMSDNATLRIIILVYIIIIHILIAVFVL